MTRVFDHWKTVHDHPRAAFDDKRRRLIRRALTAYSEADLCAAISGYRNSPHHQGKNDTGTVYDSIELILRDAAHIDAGIRFYGQPPLGPATPEQSRTQRNLDSLAAVRASFGGAA